MGPAPHVRRHSATSGGISANLTARRPSGFHEGIAYGPAIRPAVGNLNQRGPFSLYGTIALPDADGQTPPKADGLQVGGGCALTHVSDIRLFSGGTHRPFFPGFMRRRGAPARHIVVTEELNIEPISAWGSRPNRRSTQKEFRTKFAICPNWKPKAVRKMKHGSCSLRWRVFSCAGSSSLLRKPMLAAPHHTRKSAIGRKS